MWRGNELTIITLAVVVLLGAAAGLSGGTAEVPAQTTTLPKAGGWYCSDGSVTAGIEKHIRDGDSRGAFSELMRNVAAGECFTDDIGGGVERDFDVRGEQIPVCEVTEDAVNPVKLYYPQLGDGSNPDECKPPEAGS